MSSLKRTLTFLLIGGILSHIGLAQQTYLVKGVVRASDNNESLPFSTLKFGRSGLATDENGYFSVDLTEGTYVFRASFSGYFSDTKKIKLNSDTSLTFILKPSTTQLSQVEVRGFRTPQKEQVESTDMSTIKVSPEAIRYLPSIAGEPDIIKTIQLLPGVTKGVEGGTDFFVRGGDADQNLVLLDGATIYNTGHLFGFLSVFNPESLGDITVIKGGFPANYGGRLSSILDIKTADGVPDRFSAEGSIGIISSRATVRTPIIRDKLGIMFSARRTYIDQVLRLFNQPEIALPYYFYDFNGRIDFQLNQKDKFYFSAYSGRDVLNFDQLVGEDENQARSDFDFNSNSQSFGWQRIYDENKLLNVALSRSVYLYAVDNSFADNRIKIGSDIEDYALRVSNTEFREDNSKLKYGLDIITHNISPSTLESQGLLESFFPSNRSDGVFATEGALYIQYDKDWTDYLRISTGYRQSFAIADGSFYAGFEPRINARLRLNKNSSLKASYTRSMQYMHRVSTSNITLPADLWYTVTADIKPQSSNQFALGYAQNIQSSWLLEVEGYYKTLYNVTEYQEGTNLILNTDFESAILQGVGNAYGLEFLLKKDEGKFNGWISYTLSWSNRQFDGLNNGNWFPARYDRRHNISIVTQYQLNNRILFSAVWEYISGSRFTPVIGQVATTSPGYLGVDIQNIYSDRNAVSLADSHRLDIGVTFKNRPSRRYIGEWTFGVYNAYNRATPIAINIVQNSDTGDFNYEQPGLFGLIPSISYNFKF